MTSPAQSCPDCDRPFDDIDNYCRNCGMFLAATKDLTVIRPTVPTRVNRAPAVPVPVRRVATAVVVGAAVQVGLSLAGRYVVKQAAKQALSTPGKLRKAANKPAVSDQASSTIPDDIAMLNETVVVHRAWVRR